MENIRWTDAGAVRAVVEGETRKLEVLAAPFGSPSDLDKYGQYFSARTDFMIGVGDRRPTVYLHGYTPRKRMVDQPSTLGQAVVSRVDKEGLWMITDIDDSELSNRTWESALIGKAVASTGSVGYLIRPRPDKNGKYPYGSEVRCWPLAELSIYDSETGVPPISDHTKVLPLRALFDEQGIELPEHFEAGEDKKAMVDKTNLDTGDVQMEPKELKKAFAEMRAEEKALEAVELEKETAMRAKIQKEFEDKAPAYRGAFNINTITGDKGLDTDELETFAFMRALIQDGKTVAAGGQPSMRAATPLEESEADELKVLVPEDLQNKIFTQRGKYSIVRKSGMETYVTDKLVATFPYSTTEQAVTPTVAEAAAYVYNVPLVTGLSATMLKKGDLISVTEEVLEDQSLFQQFLIKSAGKSIALAENAELFALLDAIAGVEIAVDATPTDAELLAGYYALVQENRDGACWIMNDSTLGFIRGMLVATPRAYGEFGFNPLSMGEAGENLMGKPVWTNANWPTLAAAANDKIIIQLVNLSECIGWADRRGLSIFVDPYSTRVSAGTINYLPSARFGGVVLNSAACSGIDNHV